ncbi:MAG: hypothetical protein AABZ47_18415 [Planctomycetota bacterium]
MIRKFVSTLCVTMCCLAILGASGCKCCEKKCSKCPDAKQEKPADSGKK